MAIQARRVIATQGNGHRVVKANSRPGVGPHLLGNQANKLSQKQNRDSGCACTAAAGGPRPWQNHSAGWNSQQPGRHLTRPETGRSKAFSQKTKMKGGMCLKDQIYEKIRP